MTIAYILSLLTVLTIAGGQYFFKRASESLVDVTGLKIITTLMMNPWFLAAIALYATSTFLWVKALSYEPLSKLYPLMSLGYILVIVVSVIFLKESLSISIIVGTVLVMLGIIIISISPF